jgi:DNA-binding transcriptional regulator YiaG
MSATVKRPSPFLKPRERRKRTADAVKALRASMGLNQREFAETLTQHAINKRYGILITLWAVRAWEEAKREPDTQRQRVLDEVREDWEHGVADAQGETADRADVQPV